jgi:lysophospholipid acyltransferase
VTKCAVTDALGLITGKFVVCLFLSYVVGAVNQVLPRGILRHAWLAATGMATCAFVFGAPWFLLLVACVVVYVLLLIASLASGMSSMIAKLFSGAAVVLAFDIMFSRHIVRAGASAVGLDDCAAQMVLFLKLAHLCFAVYDGAGDIERLRKNAKSEAAKGTPEYFKKSAAVGRLTRALSFVPNPVAVLGYAFNPTTAMAGPAFDFSVYTLAQDGLVIDNGSMRPMLEKEAKNFSRASPVWRALLGLLFGLVLMGGFSVGSSFFPIESLFNEELAHARIEHIAGQEVAAWATPYLMGQESTNPVVRVLVLWVWISCIQFVVRLQYYGSWVVAEGASATAGFGLDIAWLSRKHEEGPLSISDQLEAYEKANNIDPIAVETARDYKTAINKWNKHTQQWLQENVFKRVTGAYGLNRHATFVVSALWHGVFPGYFLSLPVMAVAVPAMEAAYGAFQEPLDSLLGTTSTWGYLGPVGTFFRWMGVVGLLNYFMAPFMLLDWNRGLEILERTLYFGHVWIVVCIVLAVVFSRRRPSNKK